VNRNVNVNVNVSVSVNEKKKLFDFFDKNYLKFENFAGDIEKFINYI
jgi:hypothetical protein